MTDDDKGSITTQRRYATSLASFVPESVKRYIMKVVEHNGELKVPQSQSFETVALFADVSGFTALTDLLAKKGPLGAEEIGFYLNRYLEQLVKIIARSGGDVFKFAGDAIVVLWPSEQDSLSPTELADLVHRAASCSLNIQTELHNAALEHHVTMSLKLGIGVGRVTILHVGGVHGRIEFLAAGTPLMQAFRAEQKASPGDAIMSTEAWNLVATKFTGEQIDEYNVRLKGCKHAIRNISVRRTPLQWNKGSMDLLQAYVPAAVLPYLKVNQKLWSAELRQVSVIFINLGFKLEDFDNTEGISTPLDLMQKVVFAIQEATYRYEGSLNKFLVDDKGSTLLLVFGLPPLAHENDPTRAILASLTILEAMCKMNLKCKIGVTSGLALCGLVGSGSRREYSVLGDLVNLSARLMQASDGNVLCDNATFLASRNQKRLQFSSLAPIHVKGKTETVIVHQPSFAIRPERFQPVPKCKITVGLKTEIARLSSLMDGFLSDTGDSRTFVACITGEIGVGKTHLLRHLSSQYNDKLAIIWGRADPFSSMKSVQIFQSLFSSLMRSLLSHKPNSEQNDLANIVIDASRSDLIPALDLINPFDGDSSRRTSQPPLQRTLSYIDEDDLSSKILDVMVLVLQYVNQFDKKMLLIFDECQWIGQDSWKVLGNLCSMVENKTLPFCSIVVGTRPLDHDKYRPLWDQTPTQYLELRAGPNFNNVVLDNLGLGETKQLIESKTGGLEADTQLISLVFERTGGRPLFCNKFLDALLAVNALVMEQMCQLSAEWRTRGEWDTELPIPYRIQRITACQIDRLTPSQTMLLKIAAVICIAQGEGALRFNLGMIRLTNPIHEYISSISSDIKTLIKFGVVFEEPGDHGDQPLASPNVSNDGGPSGSGDDIKNELIPIEFDEEMNQEPIPYTKTDASADAKTYRFSYGFVRDFLYQIMLYKQRQKLHRICCDYIQAHLRESEDVEQEQMVLSRHIILSGANSTQFDEYLSASGTRKSTVIPSRLSASRVSRSSLNMSMSPPKWADDKIALHSGLTMSNTDVAVTKAKPFSFRKYFCCFAERPKLDSIKADRSGLPTLTPNIDNIDPGSVTAGTDDDLPHQSLKVSLTFSDMRQPSEDANRRRSSGKKVSALEGYKHQRTSIGILQELHENPALLPADRERIEFVMNTMASLVQIPEFSNISKPATISEPVAEEVSENEHKSLTLEPRLSLSQRTLPNTPRG